MTLFSCEFREGRPESAPQLRRLNNDDLQAVGEQEVDEYDDLEPHDPFVLPHDYPDDELDRLFPKAKVEDGDVDDFPDYVDDASGRFQGKL